MSIGLEKRAVNSGNDSKFFLEQLWNKPLKYEKLPSDSPAAASMRLRRDYVEKGSYDFIDYVLVFGDPQQRITFPSSPEEMLKHFSECAKKRKKFLESNKEHILKRHQEYLNCLGIF